MKYREELEPSLTNVSFSVEAGHKIGIVGRTGSGKSSILQALFRLIEVTEGSIKIDGVDIRDIGLHLLRKNMAFIPQVPFLMQGTIRDNLDPFYDKLVEDIEKVLE
jgi:ATP-binding cassette subfamily C (CFTR/MRP) protein 1